MVRLDPRLREGLLLDAATKLFVRFGFDKTTVEEVATEAGVSKGALYLHFESKGELLESLLLRELLALWEAWFDAVLADPQGGTLGGMYKAMLRGLQRSPFMAAIFRRDRAMLGSYLRQPGNIFRAAAAGQQTRHEVVACLQQAGAVRDDLDAKVIAHIMNMFSYGLVSLDGLVPEAEIPDTDELIIGIAEIMDRALTPDGGRASEAGKAVLVPVFEAGRAHLEGLRAERAQRTKERGR